MRRFTSVHTSQGTHLIIIFFFFIFIKATKRCQGPYSKYVHIPPNGHMNGRGKKHVSLIVTQEIQNQGVFRGGIKKRK